MAELIKLTQPVCEDELEEIITSEFLKRQDLMRKSPIMDERITRIDAWLLQQNPPLDVLIAIWSRANYVEGVLYGDASAEQKHLTLLNLRECYQAFQKLPQRWQEALWPIAFGKWHAEFIDEEEEAANGAA